MVKAKKAQQSIAVTWARELTKAADLEEVGLGQDGLVVVDKAIGPLALTQLSAGSHLACVPLDNVLPDDFPFSKLGVMAAMPDDTSSLEEEVVVWRSVLG